MLVQSTGIQSYNNFVQPQNSIKIIKAEVKNYENTKLQSYPNNYYMPIAFGRLSNEKLVERIGSENFPSSNLAQMFIDKPDELLYDVHKEYYVPLLECKTLDEAKELYPEFEYVIDSKDININTLKCNCSLVKIAKGRIKDANLETLSLDLLKKYYAELIGLNNKEDYYGLSHNALNDLFKQLCIPLFNKNYGAILIRSNPIIEEKRNQAKMKYNASQEGQETIKRARKKQLETINSPEGQEKVKERGQRVSAFFKTQKGQAQAQENGQRLRTLIESGEYDEAIAQGVLKQKAWWQTPEGKAQSLENQQRLENFNQTKEMGEIRNLSALSCSLSWFFNPENRNTMSEISKEYFDFVELLNKSKNCTLSDIENIVLLGYFKDCNETMPEHHKDIGFVHSLMYKELKERMQKAKDKSATDEDLTILSSYYILTKAQAPEYLDCFAEVEDTLLENEDTFNEAVNMMSDYYKYIQEKYPKEIVEKYFSRLQEVLKSSRELKVC